MDEMKEKKFVTSGRHRQQSSRSPKRFQEPVPVLSLCTIGTDRSFLCFDTDHGENTS